MPSDFVDWIAFNMIRGIGPKIANQLIIKFGSPAEVFAASRLELEKAGLKTETILELRDSAILEQAQAEIERLEVIGARVITQEDAEYPSLLREIHDPPIVLYVLGDLRVLDRPCLSIVGSRRCTTYGINAAQSLARDLAAHGVTIISGLARGIDAAAHRGALEAGGRSVAVVGTGLETTYPKEHAKLQEELLSTGAVISEFPLGTPPLPQNFPYRNRILSGLALGVLIVEAAEHSGSLITARLASEQGREIFAVPGNITSQTSFGTNYLIKDGAKLVQHWLDVVEEFRSETRDLVFGVDRPAHKYSPPTTAKLVFEAIELSPDENAVLDLVAADVGSHIDQLLISSGLDLPRLMRALLDLEMKDRIRQLPGKCFIKRI